ncbi:GTP binding protein (SPG1) [Reticulomyxa filosa]|uniref:GTP binding protein (SPG1) n=1 Tax=Reticulomyxa filosa TaxID=46433 RepID=X6M5R2_RETFI|nr:GTP binding protein (SPG1) [Reticulomyxa filosa]|eukprot:ETO08956.1 GTP binding protein (SPG1) [Reticulomyxa filosa]
MMEARNNKTRKEVNLQESDIEKLCECERDFVRHYHFDQNCWRYILTVFRSFVFISSVHELYIFFMLKKNNVIFFIITLMYTYKKKKKDIIVQQRTLVRSLIDIAPEEEEEEEKKKKIPNKVNLLGYLQIEKITLMMKYIDETLGVNFMEKTIHLKNVDIDISICSEVKKIKYVLLERNMICLMDFQIRIKQQLTTQSQKFAQKMRIPLLYCSSIKSINVATIFQFIVELFKFSGHIKHINDNYLTGHILKYNPQVVFIF